jgi:hypothetical protein
LRGEDEDDAYDDFATDEYNGVDGDGSASADNYDCDDVLKDDYGCCC